MVEEPASRLPCGLAQGLATKLVAKLVADSLPWGYWVMMGL